MNDALLQQIKSSLLHLVGRTIEALPSLVVAIGILLLTRYTANVTRKVVAKMISRAFL